MQSLLELATAIKEDRAIIPKKVILFGAPGTGKTHIAATIARVPSIKRVFWLDAENGIETLIYAKDSQGLPLLSPEQQQKIIPIRIEDTKELPRFAETALKLFTSRDGVHIDTETGKVLRQANQESLYVNIFKLSAEDAIVIDSLSQLADSVIALADNFLALDKPDARRLYGKANPDLTAILTGIQATKAAVVACTHTVDITRVKNPGTKQETEVLVNTVPMCGSRPFSVKVAKYFGYKVYTYLTGSIYRATCKAGHIEKVSVSSRRPVTFEGDFDPSLEAIFTAEEETKETPRIAGAARGAKPTRGMAIPQIKI